MLVREEIEFQGRKLVLETGRMAKQSNASVLASYGKTVVLATATMSPKPKAGADFFPLTIDYIEKMYAAGKIPGGFFKRESRPSTDATLNARMIDRPLRPLFPDGFHHEVHIVITVLAFDGENAADVLGTIAASTALMISNIPFAGPVGAVNVGLVDGKITVNPTYSQMELSKLSLSIAGTKDAINMVEAGADELSEEQVLEAIKLGHNEIKKLAAFQEAFQKKAGKEKFVPEIAGPEAELKNKVVSLGTPLIKAALLIKGKKAQYDALDSAEAKVVEELEKIYTDKIKTEANMSGKSLQLILDQELAVMEKQASSIFEDLKQKMVRSCITHDKTRADQRKLDEIRLITGEVAILPCVHGSALFTRGETQALAVVTLGTGLDEQVIDGLLEDKKRFYLHYNFPPYSVGEVGFMRGPGRRELGHGALAETALLAVLPPKDVFPYTIRILSEILESNGSSSMASVCGGTLALMDAGVPIKAPVAGIAMGLIKEGDDFAILTDIQGLEDHYGDMDFKVAGTRTGITAIQMDIKISGITEEIMKQALAQAKTARMKILDVMEATIKEPRAELSENAPRIESIKINPDKIGAVIGSGGKVIKGMQEKYGVTIEIDDDGTVKVASTDGPSLKACLEEISDLVTEVEVGRIYKGVVEKIVDFGAFVAVPGGKSALVHISELSDQRVGRVEDVLSVGQEINVKVKGVDGQGRISGTLRGL
ncbi:MAG: polyribonucleotide nucleotidyltransferase [Candidatus Margulisiibacteriota bacterium]|jgi:polyribonucleotide nucleotidyltransferase